MLLLRTFFFVLLGRVVGIRIWNSPGDIPSSVPAACRASLSSDIKCEPRLVGASEILNGMTIGADILSTYCNSSCTASIEGWARDVDKRCGSTKQAWSENITQSGNDIAQPILWAHGAACLVDRETSQYCFPNITSGTAKQCADCTLQYLAKLAGSAHGAGLIDEASFSGLVSSCGLSPTGYPLPTATNSTTVPRPTSAPARSCYGQNYTVTASDTCDSITGKFGLAIDRFLTENSIDFKCQSLKAGSIVCIGDGCLLSKVGRNQTCPELLRPYKFTKTELLAWNPIIHASCDNLASLEGRTICISPPGTNSYNGSDTIRQSNTWSLPPGSWVAAPTVGTNAPNSTGLPLLTVPAMPTSTGTINATAASEYQRYITDCPVTAADIEAGFDWELLSDNCKDLLEPYCEPAVLTSMPKPTFPASCLPSFQSMP